MTAYYNENNKKAVAALRQLIQEQTIAPGVVDERSIKEVQAHEIRKFTQWHFFAGGGLWSVAARAAGWPDSRPILSASCPCQPFSAAGKGLGTDDPRHLWPDLYRIISAARDAGFCPPLLVGEQVAGKTGYGWFDGVRADMAQKDIAGRVVDIPVCAIDAPHERNRLWWLAVANAQGECSGGNVPERRPIRRAVDGQFDALGAVEHTPSLGRREGWSESEFQRGWSTFTSADVRSRTSDVAFANGGGKSRGSVFRPGESLGENRQWSHDQSRGSDGGSSIRNGSWYADAEWIECHDGKTRRAKPGIPMLVNGMVGRGDLWSLAGNSINPLLAAEVIKAFLDVERDQAASTSAPPVLAPLPY